MEKQNVTLSLPKDLLRQAKILAVQQDKSLSQYLLETLEEKIRESLGYAQALQRQSAWLKQGFDLGTQGQIQIPRQDLHERS